MVKEYGRKEGDSNKTKVSETTYTTSSDAHFGVDLNEMDEIKLEEVVRPMRRDMADKEDRRQIHKEREEEMK